MPLYKKLIVLVSTILFLILSVTLAIVYDESQSMMVDQAKKKALSVILTVDSALQSNISPYQMQDIVVYLKRQDTQIHRFDLQRIPDTTHKNGVVVTKIIGHLLDLTTTVQVSRHTVYLAHMQISIARDMALIRSLLLRVLGVGLVAMVVAVAFLWFFSKRLLSNPLTAIASAAQDIARRHAFGHVETEALRRDEVGMLARGFVSMEHSLESLIEGISRALSLITASFEDLQTQSQRTLDGVHNVSKVLRDLSLKDEGSLLRLQVMFETTSEVRVLFDSLHALEPQCTTLNEAYEAQPDMVIAIEDALQKMLTSLQDMYEDMMQTALDVGQVSDTVSEQLRAVQRVNQSAALLHQMAMELRQLISSFEVEGDLEL